MSNTARQALVARYWTLHEKRDTPMTFHQVMQDMYIEKGMSIRDMSKELGCALGVIHKWLKDEGIERRKMTFL